MIYIFSMLLFYIWICSSYGLLLRNHLIKVQMKSKEIIILAPFLGISVILSFSQLMGTFLGARIFNPLIIGGAFVIFIYEIRKIPIKAKMQSVSEGNLFWWLGAFIITILFAFLFPSLYSGIPTSFASINNDLIFYLSIPELLLKQGYFSAPLSDQFHPFFSIAELHFSRFSRVGADYINSLGITFWGSDAVHTFNVISCFFVVLFLLSIYYLCKYCFKLSKTITYTAVTLSTINTLLFWMFTTQYMPQIAGNSFYVLSIGLIYRLIKERTHKLIIPTALVITGMVSLYSEYTVYLLLPSFLFVFLEICKNYKRTKGYLKLTISTVFFATLFNPVSSYLAIRYNYFAYTSTQNATGIVEYIPFFKQILMVLGLSPLSYQQASIPLAILSVIFLIVIVVGLVSSPPSIKLFLIVISSFIFCLLVYLYYINKFAYGYYKTMMFAQPIIILLFSIGLAYIFSRWRVNSKSAIIVPVSLILVANLYQIAKLEKVIVKDGLLVDEGYSQLSQINSLVPDDHFISIENVTKDEAHIVSFYLKDSKLNFENSNSYFAPSSPVESSQRYYYLKGNRDILNYSQGMIWRNNDFRLYKGFDAKLGEGWNGLEFWDNVPTRWSGSEFSFSINTDQKILSMQFTALLPPGVTERNIEVYLNNKLIKEERVENKTTLSLEDINFHTSSNNFLDFKIKEGAVKVGSDTRELGIAVQNVEFN